MKITLAWSDAYAYLAGVYVRRYVDVALLLGAFKAKGYRIPEGTIRRWAAECEQQTSSTGRTLYLVSDIYPKLEAWIAREDARRSRREVAA